MNDKFRYLLIILGALIIYLSIASNLDKLPEVISVPYYPYNIVVGFLLLLIGLFASKEAWKQNDEESKDQTVCDRYDGNRGEPIGYDSFSDGGGGSD